MTGRIENGMHSKQSAGSLPRLSLKFCAALFVTMVGLVFAVSSSLRADQEQNAEQLEHGRIVYSEQCASCHGQEGKGDGSAARFLDPKPRDFTTAEWKYAGGGTVEEIAGVVTEGIDDSAMTPFSDVLSEEQIIAVATYVVNVLVSGSYKNR
jgi:mono/diheme cytochrome c family protein|tara:strand:+ start:337 stop:792 length:456 start_codon:yes stop_codon:yes gene_type:complete